MHAIKKLIRLIRNGEYELLRFYLLWIVGKLLVPRYRFKWPQMAWWDNEGFTAYLKSFGEDKGMNADRRWMLHELLRLTSHVPGDTAECGVFKGASSWLVCNSSKQNSRFERMHYLFDSFEGLSEPMTSDGGHWVKGDLVCGTEETKKYLQGFDRVSFLKGWIPERFPEVEDKRFSFVHIDVDLFQPTYDSVAFFYDRLNEGGILVCDDYGFTTCPGATKAIDEFLSDKPEKMLAIPCGGGFFIKGCPTAA